jgi:hypothetical protein
MTAPLETEPTLDRRRMNHHVRRAPYDIDVVALPPTILHVIKEHNFFAAAEMMIVQSGLNYGTQFLGKTRDVGSFSTLEQTNQKLNTLIHVGGEKHLMIMPVLE